METQQFGDALDASQSVRRKASKPGKPDARTNSDCVGMFFVIIRVSHIGDSERPQRAYLRVPGILCSPNPLDISSAPGADGDCSWQAGFPAFRPRFTW
jgi:hypothetical protein